MEDKTMWCYYKDYAWDNEDLFSCKNMVRTMWLFGEKEDVIRSQDFGCLDVDAVLQEI